MPSRQLPRPSTHPRMHTSTRASRRQWLMISSRRLNSEFCWSGLSRLLIVFFSFSCFFFFFFPHQEALSDVSDSLQYFELHSLVFANVQRSHEPQVTLAEFEAAAPHLKTWGLAEAEKPRETFERIDKAKTGSVHFDEVAQWCINHHPDLRQVPKS